MGSIQLETVTDEQDLGVIISDGLKWENNNNNSIYEGRSINKLQNSVILLVFQI